MIDKHISIRLYSADHVKLFYKIYIVDLMNQR